MHHFDKGPYDLRPRDGGYGNAGDPNLPGSHASSEVLLSQKTSQEIHRCSLSIVGYPAGKKVDLDSRVGQGAGCFVKV